MSIDLHGFLQKWNLHGNPFETTNAEQEVEYLSSYFVRVDFFDKLVGEVQNSENLILFASQGHGKTSHRLEVGRLVVEHSPPALVAEFSEFDILLHFGTQAFSIETYLPVIRRKILEALIDQLVRDTGRREELQQNSEIAARFCALQQLYAKPVKVISPPEQTIYWLKYYQRSLTVVEWLTQLVDIVQQAGFASVYLLVDGVDEWTETYQNPDIAVNLLKPLLNIAFGSQIAGLSCKFFLPDYLEKIIKQRGVINLDSIPVYRLRWRDDELRDVLTKRLTRFRLRVASDIGDINFSDLCEGVRDADEQLVWAARSSPRRLIDLARQVVERHCVGAAHVEERISKVTINAVLAEYLESSQPALVTRKPMLEYIEAKLRELSDPDARPKKSIVNIYGIGGVGKSFVIRQIFEYFKQSEAVALFDFADIQQSFSEYSYHVDGEKGYSWGDIIKESQQTDGFLRGVSLEEDVHDQTPSADQQVIYVSEPANLQQKPGLLLLDSTDDLPYWKWLQQRVIKPLSEKSETLIVVTSQSPIFWHFWELREQCLPIELTPFSLNQIREFLQLFGKEAWSEVLCELTVGYPLGLYYMVYLLDKEGINTPSELNDYLLDHYRYNLLKLLIQQLPEKIKSNVDIESFLVLQREFPMVS